VAAGASIEVDPTLTDVWAPANAAATDLEKSRPRRRHEGQARVLVEGKTNHNHSLRHDRQG